MLPIRKDVSLLDYSQFLELPSTCSGTAALQRFRSFAQGGRRVRGLGPNPVIELP